MLYHPFVNAYIVNHRQCPVLFLLVFFAIRLFHPHVQLTVIGSVEEAELPQVAFPFVLNGKDSG